MRVGGCHGQALDCVSCRLGRVPRGVRGAARRWAATAARSFSVPSATSPHRATLDRYCVTCHNGRVKAGGLVLDALDVSRVTADPADLGEGRSQAARPDDASGGRAASGRGDLRRARDHLETALDWRSGRTPESRSDRYVPPSEPRRVSECDSRHPRPRCRRVGASAQGRCEPWVRQRGQRRAVADAARTLSGRRAESESRRRRRTAAVAGQPRRRSCRPI